ncbi:hypothetical protein GN956_G6469 [Arapaima gigas]
MMVSPSLRKVYKAGKKQLVSWFCGFPGRRCLGVKSVPLPGARTESFSSQPRLPAQWSSVCNFNFSQIDSFWIRSEEKKYGPSLQSKF